MKSRVATFLIDCCFAGPMVAVFVLGVWAFGWWNGAAWARGPRLTPVWWGVFSACLLAPVFATVVTTQISRVLMRLGTWRRGWRIRRGRCPYCGHALLSTDPRCAGCGWEGVGRP